MQHIHNRVRTTRRAAAEAGVSLSKRRRWFADDPNGGQAAGAGVGAGSNAGASSAGTQNTEHMLPKARFDEINTKYQELLAKVEKDKEASATAEQERLRKQGEFQQLFEAEKKRADTLAVDAASAKVLREAMDASNQARIAKLPEAMRTLVPTTLPPEQVASYLDANWTLLQGAAAPDTDAGAGGSGGGVVVTDADKQQADAAKAQGYNVTPEAIAAARVKKKN